MADKTVVLFVRHLKVEDDEVVRFVECTTVGKSFRYKNPQEFIVDFQKAYNSVNRSSCDKFTIENIVIG